MCIYIINNIIVHMVYIDVYCICSYIVYVHILYMFIYYISILLCTYIYMYLYVYIYTYIHKIGIGIVLPYWIFYRLPSRFRPDNNVQFLKVFFSESLWRAAIRRSSWRKRFNTVLYGLIMNSFLNFRSWNHAATLQPGVHQYLPAMKIDI